MTSSGSGDRIDASCPMISSAAKPVIRCAPGLVCNGTGKVCEPELPERAMCVAGGQCGSGTCAGPDGGPASCAPTASDRCFYASACSYGSDRASGGAALLALALLALGCARGRRVRHVTG